VAMHAWIREHAGPPPSPGPLPPGAGPPVATAPPPGVTGRPAETQGDQESGTA
jgi:hypothetical protein